MRELLELRRHSPEAFAKRMESYAPVHNLFEAANNLIRAIESSDETTTPRSPIEQETLDLIQRLATEIADQEGRHDEPIGIALDALMLASQERILQGLTDPASNTEIYAALELRSNSLEQFDSRLRASAHVWEPPNQSSSDAE